MVMNDLKKPVLMDYKSDEVESSFQIAKDVEVHFSCSTMFKGEYFIFGGRENQSSVRSNFWYFFPFHAKRHIFWKPWMINHNFSSRSQGIWKDEFAIFISIWWMWNLYWTREQFRRCFTLFWSIMARSMLLVKLFGFKSMDKYRNESTIYL